MPARPCGTRAQSGRTDPEELYAFLMCLSRFFFFYDATGTYKPEWLDWMG
jgi:hypothetical protein